MKLLLLLALCCVTKANAYYLGKGEQTPYDDRANSACIAKSITEETDDEIRFRSTASSKSSSNLLTYSEERSVQATRLDVGDEIDSLITTSESKSYSFCAEVSTGLTVQVANLDLKFGGAAVVEFTDGPDGSEVKLNGMIGAGLSAGVLALKGSYNLKGELQVKGILPPSIKSTEYVKAIKWILLRWLERQKEQTPAGRVVKYLANTRSINKIEGVMKAVRKRMKKEQGEELHEKFMRSKMVDDADKKFKEFTIAFRHRASKILKKIEQVPQKEHYSLFENLDYTKVFKVYVEEFWQIWSAIYMNSDVEALSTKGPFSKKIRCSNGMFGKKPSGIQQLFCTWMKYGFMLPGKDRNKKGRETENIMQSFGLVYPELFPGYACKDVSTEGEGCNGKVDVGKLTQILEEVDLPELFLAHTKSDEFQIHKKVSEMTSKRLDGSVHKEIVKHVTKKRAKMKFSNDEIDSDAKEKLDQLIVLFADIAKGTLEKISPDTEPELALQIYHKEFLDIWGEIYLNDNKALKGQSKNIECSKVPNSTPFQRLLCTFLKNGYWIPGKAGRGNNEKQNVIQSLGYVYPELFPGYSCETKHFYTARDLGRHTSTKCQISVNKLREFLRAVSIQDKRDDWADVGDENAEDFAVTGITHDLLPVDPDDFKDMWTSMFNQSQYNDGECLAEDSCGITSITFTGKRNLQLGTSGGICGDAGTGIEVTRARPHDCKLTPEGDKLECKSRDKTSTAVTVRAGGFFSTNLKWTGNLFNAPKDNGFSLSIGIRAPGMELSKLISGLTEQNACNVVFAAAEVANFVKMIVQAELQDQKAKKQDTKFLSKIKTSREKMKRLQKSLQKILKKTTGVVGNIAKAVGKKVLLGFSSNLLGGAAKQAAPASVQLATEWVFGFDLDINFATKAVDFAFVFSKTSGGSAGAKAGLVQGEAGLSLEKNTVCLVHLGEYLQDIFSKKDPE